MLVAHLGEWEGDSKAGGYGSRSRHILVQVLSCRVGSREGSKCSGDVVMKSQNGTYRNHMTYNCLTVEHRGEY